MKPLLVGESNPRSGDPRHALYPWPPGCAGARLCTILGVSEAEYLDLFDRVNLVGGTKWTARVARETARRVAAERPGHLVLLGVRVCDAFGVPWEPFHSHLRPGAWGRFWVLPHPSGRSRVWNTPGSRLTARALLHPLLSHESDRPLH